MEAGQRLRAELETDYTRTQTQPVQTHDTCKAVQLSSQAVCHLWVSTSCWNSRPAAYTAAPRVLYAAIGVFFNIILCILWQITHASLQLTMCTLSKTGTRHCKRTAALCDVRSRSKLHHLHAVLKCSVTSAELWKSSSGVLRLGGWDCSEGKTHTRTHAFCWHLLVVSRRQITPHRFARERWTPLKHFHRHSVHIKTAFLLKRWSHDNLCFFVLLLINTDASSV